MEHGYWRAAEGFAPPSQGKRCDARGFQLGGRQAAVLQKPGSGTSASLRKAGTSAFLRKKADANPFEPRASVRRWGFGITEGAIPLCARRSLLAIIGKDLEPPLFSIRFARAMSAKARSNLRNR